MALILLRHLAPDGGRGICYGSTDLAPGPGLAAGARRVAAGLPRPSRIVTSPLGRCRALARLLAARFRVSVTIEPAWREIDFGAWEGLAWERVPRAELDRWAADLLRARPHGGESVAMLLARVRHGLRRAGPGALVVTHAGAMRAALVTAGAGPAAWTRTIAFGEAIRLPPGRGRHAGPVRRASGAPLPAVAPAAP